MVINKKFIHFKRKSTFQRELDAGNIPNTSMVFISDSKQFYVNGQFFSENTLFDLNQLLENVSGELSETDTTNEAVIKLYKLIQEVNQDVNNIIKLLISEIDNLRKTTNERIDQTDQIIATVTAKLETNTANLQEQIDASNTTISSFQNEYTEYTNRLNKYLWINEEEINPGTIVSTEDYEKLNSLSTDTVEIYQNVGGKMIPFKLYQISVLQNSILREYKSCRYKNEEQNVVYYAINFNINSDNTKQLEIKLCSEIDNEVYVTTEDAYSSNQQDNTVYIIPE